MNIMHVENRKQWEKIREENEVLHLLIYKPGSEKSDCAYRHLQELEKDHTASLYAVDVTRVADIHTEYGITTAPTLLRFEKGQLRNAIKGCHSPSYFRSVITGTGFTGIPAEEGKPQKRVTVYSTPTCTFCNSLKTYLRENQVPFTDVDVSRDQNRAEEMVKKSGQQGVPQTDINGQVIVGFDREKINRLLEIR